jgi:drug/metabolite transporter (DMT)-like permease
MSNSLDLTNVHNGLAFGALFLSFVSISLAAIFITFSEGEISPYATAFNCFWITALGMGLWNQGNDLQQPTGLNPAPKSSLGDGRVWGCLLLVGVFLAIDLILWAGSLTRTSVANATLLANLTPIFTSLGGCLIGKQGRLFSYSWHGWLAVVALALICKILGQELFVYSLNHLSSAFVALFLMLDLILAAMGAWAFFSEHLSPIDGIAFSVVLLGSYLALSSKSVHKDRDVDTDVILSIS